MMIEKKEITIPLNNVRHLLVDPDCDPFKDRNLRVSGLLYAVKQLRMKPLPEKIQLNLILTKGDGDINIENVKKSLSHQCLNIVKELEEELNYLNWQVKKNFKRAVLPFLLMIVLIGSVMYNMMDERSKFVQILLVFLNNCLIIMGWVLLWIPAEMYLYGSPKVKREIALYKLLADADLKVDFIKNQPDRE